MAALASDWLRHFRLLLWNRWTEFSPPWTMIDWDFFDFSATGEREFNKTWQEARSQCPLPTLCFSGRSETKLIALASDWLRHFQLLLWIRWTEFNETWQEIRTERLLQSVCFGPIRKPSWPPWNLIGWDVLSVCVTAQRKPTNMVGHPTYN